MANLVHMIILSVCVSYVDCNDIDSSDINHMVTHKRSISYGVKDYIFCYDEFMGLYSEYVRTRHGVCKSRQKLKLCKDSVLKAYPLVEEQITKGYQHEYELLADFWCMYNTTDHRPHEPFINMDDMYRKYRLQCPYVAGIMLTHEDYSPKIELGWMRAQLADTILTYTGAAGLSQWQPNQKYSDPQKPVHKALSASRCDAYKYQTYLTDNIMSRYCVIIKDIDSDLHNVLDTYNRHTVNGLYNWNTSLCTAYEDVLKQVMSITQLEKWLSRQRKPDLSQCHDHNIYIEGAKCLIMFHTRLPPYSDFDDFMPPFVNSITELKSCWDRVISGCPDSNSVNKSIELIIEIYDLASEISKQDSAQVWDVIYSWSGSYKKTEDAQWRLQGLDQNLMLSTGPSSFPTFPLAFGGSLQAALNHTSPPPHVTALFRNLSSALDRISIVSNDDYSGVNIFEGFSSMNVYVLDLLFNCISPLYELFVEVGKFVEYKGVCPEWWTPACEA